MCGQDPRYCRSQLGSDYTNQWPDDITQWPVGDNVVTVMVLAWIDKVKSSEYYAKACNDMWLRISLSAVEVRVRFPGRWNRTLSPSLRRLFRAVLARR